MNADPVENVLNEFRAWLHQGGAQGDLPSAEEEAIDLNALLREMVALKHEVNLQTRASRAQLDQNAEAVKQLAEALPRDPRQQDLLAEIDKQLEELDALNPYGIFGRGGGFFGPMFGAFDDPFGADDDGW